LLSRLSIHVNDHIFLKDPESSDLGKRIVTSSIDLIHEIGFENFTFKKLGKEIGSQEASVYRYFESKHKVLLYLTNWYWGWMAYRLTLSLANIDDPVDRLKRAVNVLTKKVDEDSSFSHINEVKLHQIVISESSKSYLNKHVKQENSEGAFLSYKTIVAEVSDIIKEINPSFACPHMLVSTVIEGAHHQRYFAMHLPKLTDVQKGEDLIPNFYKQLVLKTIAST
jgi:AcrR family transcriptional regulator